MKEERNDLQFVVLLEGKFTDTPVFICTSSVPFRRVFIHIVMDLNSLLSRWTHLCDDATLALIATNHQSILGAFFVFGFLMLLVVQVQLLASSMDAKKDSNGLCNYKIKVSCLPIIPF